MCQTPRKRRLATSGGTTAQFRSGTLRGIFGSRADGKRVLLLAGTLPPSLSDEAQNHAATGHEKGGARRWVQTMMPGNGPVPTPPARASAAAGVSPMLASDLELGELRDVS